MSPGLKTEPNYNLASGSMPVKRGVGQNDPLFAHQHASSFMLSNGIVQFFV